MTACRTLQIGHATVYVDPVAVYVRTTFPDGAFVEARPQYRAEDHARAADLGYAGVEAMTLAHDVCHSFLAWKTNGVSSPTLWNVAHGIIDDELAGSEEAAVMAFQRFINNPETHRFPIEWRAEALALLAAPLPE